MYVSDYQLISINDISKLIIKSSFVTLIVLWFLMYIGCGVLFGLLYSGLPSGAIGGDHPPVSFWDFLYFSFTTQATVGYGDCYPLSGWARFFSIIQGAVGTAFAGLILGVATFKLIKGQRKSFFTKNIFFLPEECRLMFQYTFEHLEAITNIKIKAQFRRLASPNVDLEVKTLTPKYRGAQLLVNGIQLSKSSEVVEEFIPEGIINPIGSGESSYSHIFVELLGSYEESGNNFFERKKYASCDLMCIHLKNCLHDISYFKSNEPLPCDFCDYKERCRFKEKLVLEYNSRQSE